MQSSEKKVLMLTHGFPSYGGRGNIKLMKYLPSYGYHPIILTTSSKKDHREYEVLKAEFNGKCKYYKTFCINRTPFRIFSKFFNMHRTSLFLEKFFFVPDLYISWLPSAIYKGMEIIYKEKIDVIISASPPESIHIAGLLLSKLTGAKLIVDFRDLWTTRTVAYKPPTFLHDIIIKKIEKLIYKYSDHIIANTHGNKRIYTNHFYITENKITVITNGFDPEDISDKNKKTNHKNSDKMTIGYMGNFDKYGLPCDKFLLAIKKIIDLGSNVKIRVIIYGHVSPKTIQFIEENDLTQYIDLRGVVPHHMAFKEIQKCDLLLLLLIEAGYSKAWVPHKLYHYLNMSKPIISISDEDGEIAQIIKSTNTGRVVSPRKQDVINEVMYGFYNEWKNNGFLKYKPNIEQIKKYDVRVLTEKLAKTISSLSG